MDVDDHDRQSGSPMTRLAPVVVILGLDEAKQKVQDSIIEAEQFCATIAEPKGNDKLSDDDFFHIMSHVEPNLASKIGWGEFVDLEKLLPRDKFYRPNEGRMEWVHRDCNTYLVPANRESKINSIRRWEQAFRVYATIYCGANPSRSKEVWQYIAVINAAAASYAWDNVAAYDMNFRYLMAFNPKRSWAIMYNHMWNLCLKDPIVKSSPFRAQSNQWSSDNFSPAGNSMHHSSGSANSNYNNSSGQSKKVDDPTKPTYCWNWNKGVKCRFGKKCKFIERCSYCDSGTQGLHQCCKAKERANNN